MNPRVERAMRAVLQVGVPFCFVALAGCSDDGQTAFVPKHPWLGDGSAPIAISHEGVRAADDPITVAGFVAAHALGFEHMETDLRLLASGELVAYHDVGGSVEDLELADVKQQEGADAAPTVEELLDHADLAGVRWNFELKGGDEAAATALAAALDTPERADRVCVSFGTILSRSTVQAIRSILPVGLCTCASILERGLDWGLFVGMFGGVEIDERAACAQLAHEPLLGTRLLQVGAADVRQAHGRGLAVHVYDVLGLDTSAAEVERWLDLGVDGIITDDHEVVRDVFVERGYWPAGD